MGKQHRSNNIPERRSLKWQPFNFCIICNDIIDYGKMCDSCASFIIQKQKEEKRRTKKYKKIIKNERN